MKTFCPWLWEEMFINEKGNVYSCCHQFPGKLGNIKDHSLKEIYSSTRLQSYRKKSLGGILLCGTHCTLLSPAQRRSITHTDISAEYTTLKRLKICIGTACNIRCIMCWQDHDNPKLLSLELLKKQIDFSTINEIDLQGGEPLFIPAALDFYKYCADHDVTINFLTNGMLLSDEWIENVIRHSKIITISLNAATAEMHEAVNLGSKWDTVLANAKKLRQRRDDEKSSMQILGHMTLIAKNVREVAQFIRKMDEFHFDRINFGFDQRLRIFLALHPHLHKQLRAENKQAYEECNDKSRIDLARLRILKLI